jgi:hypothetical protein
LEAEEGNGKSKARPRSESEESGAIDGAAKQGMERRKRATQGKRQGVTKKHFQKQELLLLAFCNNHSRHLSIVSS